MVMLKQALIVLALLGALQVRAGMSDIHLQTTEAISSHFPDYSWDDLIIERMQFTEAPVGCALAVRAEVKISPRSRVADYTCKVCFEKRAERSYLWTDVICE